MAFISFKMIVGLAAMGTFAGFSSGLLGIGGGVILVPLFLWCFPALGFNPQILVQSAFATSLAIIIPTSISNTLGHYRKGQVCRAHVIFLAIGATFGAFCGAELAILMSGESLKTAFALLQFAIAARLLTGATLSVSAEPRDRPLWLIGTGVVGGGFSSFFGIGGGVIAVPLMVMLLRLPIHLAVGNSSALIVVSSLVGTLAYILKGFAVETFVAGSLGFVYLPALVLVVPFSLLGSRWGVRLAGQFSHAKMMRIFAVLLVGVGIQVLWGLW